MNPLNAYEQRLMTILEDKLKAKGIDPSADDLTQEQIAEIEELTKESQDEALRG